MTTPAGQRSPPAEQTPIGPTPPGQATPPAQRSPPTAEPTDSPVPTPPTADEPPAIGYETVADGFNALTMLTHAGDGSRQIYVVEQRGLIRAGTTNGTFDGQPFLDIRDRVRGGGERGLLGLAFHPGFAENGRLFVNYTDRNGNTVVAEFRRSGSPGSPADPASERVLLQIEQPFANHNGGMVVFGPDGMLYISTGDGGSAGDPLGAGQDRSTLLGKILRIDVDGEEPYAIPAGNPFVDGAEDARPEIWAYGLRNPWRVTFDRQTGDLFIADVGQREWEEINAEPAGTGGRNYGWDIMEGPDCFRANGCDMTGLSLPVYWYPTDQGCAVTGGYVYRGSALAGLAGYYLFADYCSGDLWALDAETAVAGSGPLVHEMGNAGINVTSFGEDEAGELYIVGRRGEVLRVIAAD